MWVQSPSIRIYRSFDMGFSPDPAVCLWIAHLGNRYIVFKEKLWHRTVASDIAKDIIAESEGLRVNMTYCDPSMDFQTGADIRTIKDIFEENGVPMEKSVNNREHYAHAVHTALAEEVEPGIPRLQILDGSGKPYGCPYLIRTIPLMQFDEKRPMAMADHRHDHAVVALAYFLISHSSYEHRSLKTTSTPRWLRPKQSKQAVLGSESVRDRF
jgi:hypothetical protein